MTITSPPEIPPDDLHLKQAREMQSKFDQYLPALAFTILGLAVQTAKWAHPVSERLEIGGWTLLFLSGVLGLLKLERAPGRYSQAALVNHWRSAAKAAEGQSYFDSLKAAALADAASRRLNALGRVDLLLYQLQRSSLIVGMAAMLAARAIAGLLS